MLGNRIYVCGGEDQDRRPLHSCERYDPAENKWEAIGNMTEARMGYRLVTADGRLYALGGYYPYPSAATSVEMNDPIEDKWSPHLPDLLHQRRLSSAVVLPGIYNRCRNVCFCK